MSAHANDVVVALASARRVVQLYPETHGAFTGALDAVVDAVGAAAQSGSFTLGWHQGRLYDGSDVISAELPGAKGFAALLESRDVESLVFLRGFSVRDAAELLRALEHAPTGHDALTQVLAEVGVHHVRVAQFARAEESDDDAKPDKRQGDRVLHQRLLTALGTVMSQIDEGASPDFSESRELVEGLLGRMLEDRGAVLGLATIRGAGERMLHHSLNVMIYSCVLGRRLGLPETSLAVLGCAALLHDIGKSAQADDEDHLEGHALYAAHPERGARVLRELALEDPAPLLVAFEHHMRPDGGGFPQRAEGYVAHPFSRIVAIANRFDNLTTAEDGDWGLTPDRAMIELMSESPAGLDPFLLRVFASAMGVFPVGCVVRLSDHSVGIVAEPGDDPTTPAVKLVFDANGRKLNEGPRMEMATSGLRLVEVLEPAMLALEVAEEL